MFTEQISGDSALRQSLIAGSRAHAECDRRRLAACSFPNLTLLGAAGVIVGLVLGGRHKVAAAAVLLAAGYCLSRGLAARTLPDSRSPEQGAELFAEESPSSSVDQSSWQSFPASDPPA